MKEKIEVKCITAVIKIIIHTEICKKCNMTMHVNMEKHFFYGIAKPLGDYRVKV